MGRFKGAMPAFKAGRWTVGLVTRLNGNGGACLTWMSALIAGPRAIDKALMGFFPSTSVRPFRNFSAPRAQPHSLAWLRK